MSKDQPRRLDEHPEMWRALLELGCALNLAQLHRDFGRAEAKELVEIDRAVLIEIGLHATTASQSVLPHSWQAA